MILLANIKGKKARDKIPASDFAGPHESYPITTQHQATSAWRLRGHADNKNKVAQRIEEIASRKGFSLPNRTKG